MSSERSRCGGGQVVQPAVRTTRTPPPHDPPGKSASTRKLTGLEISSQSAQISVHLSHRSPTTTSQTALASPHHAPNHSCSPSGGARAAANSGASNGNPMARSTRSIELGSWTVASSRRVPTQFGHVKISTRKPMWACEHCRIDRTRQSSDGFLNEGMVHAQSDKLFT
ncbi:MAG: hypothetical protein ACJA0V_002829 [Planctomycetota bacterium]